MATTKRVFLGIPLLPSQQQALYEALAPTRQQCPDIRWIPSENYHITLHFFGDTAEDQINTIRTQLTSLAALHPKFTLPLQHLILFPPRKPRMVWATADQQASFTQLTLRIQSLFASPTERHASVIPHVTLARWKHFKHMKAIPLPHLHKTITLAADTMVLWESFLSRSGASYQRLATLPFTGIA